MLERTEPAHGESEARGQPRRRPAIDQEPGAVLQSGGCVLIEIVPCRRLPHIHEANSAASAAPMNLIRNYPRLGGRVGGQPGAYAGIRLQLKVRREAHRVDYGRGALDLSAEDPWRSLSAQ